MTNAEAPTAREPVIDVRNVSKWFGNVVAVNDISFQVLPGITGLVVPIVLRQPARHGVL